MGMSPERAAHLQYSDDIFNGVLYDWQLSPREAAECYFSYHQDLPKPLRYWPRKTRGEAKKRLSTATSTASKFFGAVDEPRFFTLHLADFDLPKDSETADMLAKIDPENPFYLWQNVGFWKLLITSSFKNELFWKLEANSRRVCAHVIAGNDAGLQHLPRHENSELVKRVTDPVGLYAYLLKEPLALKEEPKDKTTGLRYDLAEAINRLEIFVATKRFFAERGRLQNKYHSFSRGRHLVQSADGTLSEPAWVTLNEKGNDYRPDQLPRTRGFWKVRGAADGAAKLNPSDIVLTLQSNLYLRQIVEQEKSMEERAKRRDLSFLQDPPMFGYDRTEGAVN